ncbi:MAG: hypothetical protein WAR57_13125 [Candidatus Phosphoribacter sp.]|nr:hypothetical protein [Actinomycetales bacterium]
MSMPSVQAAVLPSLLPAVLSVAPTPAGMVVGVRVPTPMPAGTTVSAQAATTGGVDVGDPASGTPNAAGDAFVSIGSLAAGTYLVKVTTIAGADTSATVQAGPVTVGGGPGSGDFVPVGPIRSFDSRVAGSGGAWSSGQTRTVQMLGIAGVPTTGVSAVAVALSVVAPNAPGYLTAWPSGQPRPFATAVNFSQWQTKTNLVKVPADGTGLMSIYNFSGVVGVTVDVVGFFVDDSGTFTHTVSYQSITPTRVLDTRPEFGGSGVVAAGTSKNARVAGGTTGVPATATAVEIQVEAVDPAAAGFLTVWAAGAARPVVSNVLYGGSTTVTSAIAPVGAGGEISIFTNVTTQLGVDIAGYYDGGAGGKFVPVAATRIYDTRVSPQASLGSNEVRTIKVAGLTTPAGVTPIPPSATSVVFAATAVNNQSPGYQTFWPGTASQPLAAMLLPDRPNALTDNLVVSGLGNGNLAMFNFTQPTDLVIDVNGYYANEAPAAGGATGIRGTVLDDVTNAPIEGVLVTTWDPISATLISVTTTDSTGYFADQVPAGDHRVCYYGSWAASASIATGYLSNCLYSHSVWPTEMPRGDAVTVPSGSLVPLDTTLLAGGEVTGTVIDRWGTPRPDLPVFIYLNFDDTVIYDDGVSGAGGAFVIPGVPDTGGFIWVCSDGAAVGLDSICVEIAAPAAGETVSAPPIELWPPSPAPA